MKILLSFSYLVFTGIGASAAPAPGPVDIGSHRQLFVDREVVGELHGAWVKQGEPVPREIAIRNDRPWDHAGPMDALGMFRRAGWLYYYYRDHQVGDPEQPEDLKEGIVEVARSRDGIVWEKPDLEAVAWEGSRANNIVQGVDGGPIYPRVWFFIDPRPKVPEAERRKALVFPNVLDAWGGKGPARAEVWVSDDGARFRASGIPIQLASSRRNAFDTLCLFWSETEQRFVGYFRWMEEVPVDGPEIHPQFRGGKGRKKAMRSMFRSDSPDLIHWSKSQAMDFGGTPREEIYESGTFPYFRAPDHYIGLACRFFEGRKALSPAESAPLGLVPSYSGSARNHTLKVNARDNDCNDMVLLATRPGSATFTRLFMEAFVRPGTDPGNWTSRNNYSCEWVYQTGPDEMSFLVRHDNHRLNTNMQRYSLRLDGFASINAPYSGGEMVTVPLLFSGDRLELNYATSAAGQIQVEIEDSSGQAIPGFALKDSAVLIGDRIAGETRWRSSAGVGALAGEPVRLRFVMRDADLYSFRFHSSADPSPPLASVDGPSSQ